MMIVRFPPVTPDEFGDYEDALVRFDDHLDAEALQARREEIDRLAVPVLPDGEAIFLAETEALAISMLVMLAAVVIGVCVAVLAYVL